MRDSLGSGGVRKIWKSGLMESSKDQSAETQYYAYDLLWVAAAIINVNAGLSLWNMRLEALWYSDV